MEIFRALPYALRDARYVNTEGPMEAEEPYRDRPLDRVDLDEVLILVRRKAYFTLCPPRQSGKTTALGALAEHLGRTGRFQCVDILVGVGLSARQDVAAGMRAILRAIEAEWTTREPLVNGSWPASLAEAVPHLALERVLAQWAAADSRPLVLLVDEVDAPIGDTLISFLRQIRSGSCSSSGLDICWTGCAGQLRQVGTARSAHRELQMGGTQDGPKAQARAA